MKITDNDIKKTYEQMEIPDPSKSAKNSAMQEALKEFAKKSDLAEKKSKGFGGYLRQMGKTLFETLTMKGEPIMTQRQFATVGILVIAVGLIVSIGPQMFQTTQQPVKLQLPEVTQQPRLRVDHDEKQDIGK